MTISELFEKERPMYVICVKSDSAYNVSEGTKYKIESYTTRSLKLFMLFKNDNNDELELQVGESSKHFIPIISDRKRKLDRVRGL